MSHSLLLGGAGPGITALILAMAGCTAPSPGTNPGGDAFQFVVPPTIDATVGPDFFYSFCEPWPTSNTDACGPFPETTNPTGGQPPYHFQLGSGTGFPPHGVTLNKDGLLQGTIPVGSAERTYPINVCAVDLSADAVCRDVVIIVGAAPTCPGDEFAGTTWDGTFRIKSGTTVRYTAPFEFRFGQPEYFGGGVCNVPVEEASVDDPEHPWVVDENATDPPQKSLVGNCSEDRCTYFHLVFGMPNGPGVEEVGGGTALRMDASDDGSGGRSVIEANRITGSAGTGGYGGGCCWGGDFDAALRSG